MRLLLGGMRTPENEQAALRMLTPGPAGFLDRLAEPDRLPDWLSRRRTATHYVEEFSRTGFTGGAELVPLLRPQLGHPGPSASPKRSRVPALFIGGTDDPTLGFTRVDRAREVVTGPYRQVLLDGAGHWIQQERPDEVNRELVSFLSGLEF